LRISKGLKGGRKRRRTRRVGLSRILGFFGSVNHGNGTVSVYYDLFVGESNGFARFTFGRCLQNEEKKINALVEDSIEGAVLPAVVDSE
jgi:hypothetical protein